MTWWTLPSPWDWILSILAVVVFHGGLILILGSNAYGKIIYGLLLLFVVIIPVASLSLFTLFLLPFAPLTGALLSLSFVSMGGYGVYWSYKQVF